jgi:hypothetical protein
MKLLFKRFSVFLILLVITLYTLQLLISNIIDNKSVNGQDNLDQTVSSNADVIFLGSSRILATINPKLITDCKIKSENLGAHGQGIRFAIARYKNYLTKNAYPPKIIVCSLEPVFESGYSTFMKDRFARYSWNANSKDSQILDYFKFDWFEKNIPLFALLKYRKIWDCILLNNRSSWLTDGMEHRYGNICKTSITNTEFASIGYNLKEMENQIVTLKKLTKKNKSKLVFIQLPFYHQKKRSTIKQFLLTEQICKKHDIELINLFKDEFNTNCSIFSDPYHFNTQGSEIITRAIIHELQKYIYPNQMSSAIRKP